MSALITSYHLVATLLFVGVSAVVGVRLLRLAASTHEKPELLLGLGVLGTAVLGYGVQIAAIMARGPENRFATTELALALQGAGIVLHDAGVSMVILFSLTVFRRGERWALALATVMLAALWGGCIGWESQNHFRDSGIGDGFWWLRYAVIWTYPLWPMFESYRYYRMMRRRLALGLADPLVTNRFFLWGTGSLGTALAIWSASFPFLLGGPDRALGALPAAQVGAATFGLATVVIYSLTFFPPPAYRRWVTRGVTRMEGAPA